MWPQKLQGAIVHGSAVIILNVLPFVRSGANSLITCFLRVLQLLGSGPPPTVYLQVDGGSENWNIAFFALCDLLFDIYPTLQELYISRLGVGHTHADIDRAFSYLNSALFGYGPRGNKTGKNIITREEFVSTFREALANKKDVMYLDHIFEDLSFSFDFWGFIRPHLYKVLCM